jgi:hypothetical protein
MKKYEFIELAILKFEEEDVIRTSGNPEESGDNIIDGDGIFE